MNPAVNSNVASPIDSTDQGASSQVCSATLLDTLAIFADVLAPAIAKGVILRRRSMVTLAEKLNLDRRAIQRMDDIRGRYPRGPLLLRIPKRSIALLFHPEDVNRVLENTPEPFATATLGKRAALAHFEPKNVLISEGAERAERRRYNEEVLNTNRPIHRLADTFLRIVASEADRLMAAVSQHGELYWPLFSNAWTRVVRRVIFGDAASDDDDISRTMTRLRSAANWAFLRPQSNAPREHLFRKIRGYLESPAPHSLAGVMAHTHASPVTAPEQQVPQWLFAFDPAGMTTFRTLALLATHPEFARKVREEIGTHRNIDGEWMPNSRAAVLESLRLWPTTSLLLRESRAATSWETGVLPPETTIVIYTPFFHRSPVLPYADVFSPQLWLNSEPPSEWPLIPFSEGPATCPGRQLVLLLATAMLGALLERAQVRIKRPHPFSSRASLPGTLNHFALRFELRMKHSQR